MIPFFRELWRELNPTFMQEARDALYGSPGHISHCTEFRECICTTHMIDAFVVCRKS